MTEVAAAIRTAAEVVLAAALLITLAHLLRARTVLDRVVALEVTAAIMVGGSALLAIARLERTMIDIALVVALVSFTGNVAFASFVEGRRRRG